MAGIGGSYIADVMFDPDADSRLRGAAFAFLTNLAERGIYLVGQKELSSFAFEGAPFRLMATQQGIWKPRELNAAISFRTVYSPDPSKRPYDDEAGPDGFVRYKWRGNDPEHPDNRALRNASSKVSP
jgi:putative restriction endonuclease